MPSESKRNKIISALCVQQALDLLMVDSSDDDEEDEIIENFTMKLLCLMRNRRTIHLGLPKSAAWQKNVLQHFDDNTFSQIIGISSREFAHILGLIKNDNVFHTSMNASQLPIELQLKIVLYRLGICGDEGSVRKVACLFGVGDGGTTQKVTNRVFGAILKLKSRFLCWPNDEERRSLISATSNEMPGCIGYIGGSEIKLAKAPVKHQELFFSHSHQYCVKMQAICDYKLRIRRLSVGHPGSVRDAKIFSNSLLAKHPACFLSTSQWIAGDSGYPLKPFLLTPITQDSVQYSKEDIELFNMYFLRHHTRIENCFDKLKEKFASLKEMKYRMISEQNKKECNNWITVCCILHNILLEFNEKKGGDSEVLPPFNLLPASNSRDYLMNFIKAKNF